jgi:hypothetical protein
VNHTPLLVENTYAINLERIQDYMIKPITSIESNILFDVM